MQKTEVININMSFNDFQLSVREIVKGEITELLQKLAEQKKAPPDWEELTLREAAVELKCCKRTVRDKMKELNIKGLCVGREITLQRKDLKKIRQAQERQRDSQPS